MTSLRLPDRLCDCRCPVHRGSTRPLFDLAGCACRLTCSTQPPTLVVREWRCALFLHPESDNLWFVMSAAHEKWDWGSANEIDSRSDFFEVSRPIETSLRQIRSAVADSTEIGSA